MSCRPAQHPFLCHLLITFFVLPLIDIVLAGIVNSNGNLVTIFNINHRIQGAYGQILDFLKVKAAAIIINSNFTHAAVYVGI